MASRPDDRVGDLGVHVLDRAADALAAEALAAVAQLDGLVRAGARAARHDGAAGRARDQLDLDLDGGIAPRVEHLTPDHLDDRAHDGVPFFCLRPLLPVRCRPHVLPV